MKLRFAFLLLAALSLLCVMTLIMNRAPDTKTASVQTSVPVINTSLKESALPPAAFERSASAAVPSVVHIRSLIRHGRNQYRGQSEEGANEDAPNDNYDNEEQDQSEQPDQMASGSGVIIRSNGYIVTNNHVVDGSSELTVTLNDHKNYRASVVGTDQNSDLAVIKIEAENLPVISVGNSDEVKLGEGVLAIGYPLNLDVTVTQGIVSAKSRNIGINRQAPAPVEAYIQTDAAVNPGSSGGALVNMNGELVGINSAIASPTGSFAGYAYAIPSNMVKKVSSDLMQYGSVQRGFLGISLAPDNLDDAAKSRLGMSTDINGLFVMDVNPSGAADEAGIRKGDVITKVENEPVNTSSQLIERIARQSPGDKVSITVMSDNQEKNLEIVLKK